MNMWEYVNNIVDINHIWFLILNDDIQKIIDIGKNINKNYDVSSLTVSIGPVSNDIHTITIYNTMKVRYRNIKYPFITLSNVGNILNIWEGKTAKINTLKVIKLMFR